MADLDLWIRDTAPRALAYARSLLHDVHQAEDVVQECYCRLLGHADEYDLPQDGLKILLRAITNAAINLRTRRRPMLSIARPDDDWGAAEPADRRTPSPEGEAQGRELQTLLRTAMAELPAQQRAALELKTMGHSPTDIADILGVSVGNAGVLVHRARALLAERLASYLGGEQSE